MSHEGDCAGDPPQQPSHRLASTCESAPSPKRRGISRGINLEMVWQANGKPFGNNAKYFTLLVGNQVRFTMPSCYPSWTEVPEEQRARATSMCRAIGLLDEYRGVCAAVDRLAADRYSEYKLKVHNHLKAHAPSRPYGEMSAEDWQKCIDFFTSPTFVERSSKNKANRGKAKYPSVQGSKSFSAMRYDERDPEAQQWPGIIELFRTFHTFQDGNWVNQQAAGDYVRTFKLC
ncbi:Uncharacterized protein Adt_39467 [Abeliophyllum distichum]|uniref:Uncharacterized protein n=1 Tax=Abeliophyllum distichum TaxID=126358 RepID=A0ABD1Q5A4_9LAMI